VFNSPVVDLYDPQLPDQEIDRDEFERAWGVPRSGRTVGGSRHHR
jgi:hypothetical protein